MAITHPVDQCRDIEEVDPFLKEEGHGLFVGGVHHRRHRAAGAAGRVGQLHAGVFGRVGGAEAELAHLGEIEPAPGGAQALGPAEAIKNGQLHIGPAELGQHRGIGQLNHRMNDRLGVDDDLDVVVVEAKQVVGLDHLQALVH